MATSLATSSGFSQLCFYVPDVKKAADAYTKAFGFTIDVQYDDMYICMKTGRGGTLLGLASYSWSESAFGSKAMRMASSDTQVQPCELQISVPDTDAATATEAPAAAAAGAALADQHPEPSNGAMMPKAATALLTA